MERARKHIRNKPHLKLITESVFDIPNRLKEYNEHLFVVYNVESKRYEVHSTDNKAYDDTQCIVTPKLDFRTLKKIKANDIAKQGRKFLYNLKESKRKADENKAFMKHNRSIALGQSMHQHVMRLAEEENM